jgi:hypothetical protein
MPDFLRGLTLCYPRVYPIFLEGIPDIALPYAVELVELMEAKMKLYRK